jgi:hypothetical protein
MVCGPKYPQREGRVDQVLSVWRRVKQTPDSPNDAAEPLDEASAASSTCPRRVKAPVTAILRAANRMQAVSIRPRKTLIPNLRRTFR